VLVSGASEAVERILKSHGVNGGFVIYSPTLDSAVTEARTLVT
jgi:hypothetical protein